MCKPNRRNFIKLNLRGLIGVSACMPFLSDCLGQSTETQQFDWKEFNKRLKYIADQLNNKEITEDDYLKLAADISGRLDTNDAELKTKYAKYKNKHIDFNHPALRHWNLPEIRKIHGEQTFQISLLEFEPNEEIYLHDHPGMTGVAHCIKGNVHVINYDLLPRLWRDPMVTQETLGKEVLLREVSNAHMKPGDISTLSATHRNIHWLKANSFSRVIDIFAPPYDYPGRKAMKRFKITDVIDSNYKIYKAGEV